MNDTHEGMPMAADSFLRSYVAYLENVTPSQLCFVAEGGGLKGKGSAQFKSHRDETDIGRIQCVMALSDVGFDVWPLGTIIKFWTSDWKYCTSWWIDYWTWCCDSY